MGYTHHDKICLTGGRIAIGPAGQEKDLVGLFEPGNQFFVDSGTGADTNDGLTWGSALATVDAAIGKCTANNGDIIWIAPGHTETWTTTGAKLVADIAGVRIVGLGQGADRPTFSFGHTGTTWTISAASVTLANLLLVSAVDSITTFGTISGADCTLLDIETRDTTDVEVIDAFIVTGDRLIVERHFHNGYTGGNANARVFKMTGVDNALFDRCRFMTKVTTAVINFSGTACTNIVVKECDFLVTSTTNLSKTVVDTIGGSTWEVTDCFDLGAGASFSGGSGSALASDDVSAIAASIGTLANTGGTATLAGILGDVSNVTIAASLAKIGTLVNSGGTATLGGILGDLANVTVATWLQKIGALTNSGGTATLGAIIGDVANSDIATRMKKLTQCNSVALVAADMTGTVTRFTVAGGPVLIRHIGMLVTTAIPAGANTLKFSITPTGGGATDLSGATDTASAGAQQLFVVDGVKATGLVKTTDVGIMVAANENMPIVVGTGVIQTIFSAGPPATGAATLYIEWEPMVPGATVS